MMLRIEGVHKRFDDTEVLKGIDLDVNKGDVVAYWAPAARERPRFCGA